MVHLGRHSAEPAVWRKAAMAFGKTVTELCKAWAPWRPKALDIGGGFPAPRDPTHPERSPAPAIGRYAEVVCSALRETLEPESIALQIEPGRSLFADAGIHLSRVRHVKEGPYTWVEIDTTEMFLPDLMIEHAYFRPVFASRADAPTERTVQIVGISCGFDLIARDVEAPRVDVGDTIAFLDTGAYQDAAATNFNVLARPGTVLVSGSDARMVKRHETIDDVLARDLG